MSPVASSPPNVPRGIGVHVYGAAAIVLGLVGLVSRDFAAVWQPVPATIPGHAALACLTGAVFVACGLAVPVRRSPALAAHAALVLAALYIVFGVLWLPRVAMFPRAMGTWNGVFEQLAPAAAAVACYATLAGTPPHRAARLWRGARILFGVCLVSFGLTHFDALRETASLVPTWLPPSGRFWAMATGVCHVAAGVAILSGVRAVLAARLFTAMLVGFGALVWAPSLVANPHAHVVWAGNAINLVEVGAAWLMADVLAAAGAARRAGSA